MLIFDFVEDYGLTVGAFLVAFAFMGVITPLVIRLAHHKGWVAQPKADRWHETPTALMGGVAIFIAAMTSIAIFFEPSMPVLLGLGAGIMFLTGLVDDLFHIGPSTKLLTQILAAGLVLPFGYYFGGAWPIWISIPLTFFWIIGITNALNLLDNMDGLSAGVAAIIAAVLGIFGVLLDIQGIPVVAFAVAGAAAGFLLFNFKPARIFMGDSGSLFLGYSVAVLSLAIQNESSSATESAAVLLVSISILAVPIFDTTLVTVMRMLAGRSVSEGGRDHSSHRLVFLGLSERQAVLMLYGISLLFGGIGVLILFLDIKLFSALLTFLTVGLVVFGIYLSHANVYQAGEWSTLLSSSVNDKIFAFLSSTLGTRWRVVGGVVLDLLVVSASFVLAHYLKYGEELTALQDQQLVIVVPLVVIVKIAVFYVMGLYKGIWRFAGTPEFIRIMNGMILASVLVYFTIAVFYPAVSIPVGVYLIDLMITGLAVTAVRFSFRGFRHQINAKRATGKKILIFGAGDAGMLALRELRQNPELGMAPVGFIDDDAFKQGLWFQGIKVLGTLENLPTLCNTHGVEALIIATKNIWPARIEAIRLDCQHVGIACMLFQMRFDLLQPGLERVAHGDEHSLEVIKG